MTAPARRAPRMDPIDNDPRCVHDMLIFNGRSTCSICQGLPDVPENDSGDLYDTMTSAARLVWGVSDRHLECIRCGTDLPSGQTVAYSPAERGPVGICCEPVR